MRRIEQPGELQRRTGESFMQLLQRLDDAIALAWSEEIYTDEINASV